VEHSGRSLHEGIGDSAALEECGESGMFGAASTDRAAAASCPGSATGPFTCFVSGFDVAFVDVDSTWICRSDDRSAKLSVRLALERREILLQRG